MIARLMLLLFLFMMPFHSAQAQKACTKMWCDEGIKIELKSAYWPRGEYDFIVNMGGHKTACTSILPFQSCSGNTVCDNQNITIGESGCAMERSNHGYYAIMSKNIVEYVTLSIQHESGKNFEFKSDVEGQCFYPNGEKCDLKQCCSARLVANVEWKKGL